MTGIKAVITDYIGTLVAVRNYQLESSHVKLYTLLVDLGFELQQEEFLEAYRRSHEKYRKVRYKQLIEITNKIWISDALNHLGYQTNPEDQRIKTALNLFFDDYLAHLELKPYAKELLKKLGKRYKLGLISNFTFAPVIHASLRKLGINHFFNAIIVSDDFGWRKPHKKIFLDALRKLQVTPDETVYIGDSPLEDIKGAKALGIKTVFVPSQFYSTRNLQECNQKPDLIIDDLNEFWSNQSKVLS